MYSHVHTPTVTTPARLVIVSYYDLNFSID